MADSKQQNQHKILVAVAGGGPAGLLTSILLNRIGVESTVVETTIEPDTWSTKSYTLVLGTKGKGCLAEAGCLEEALASGNERRFIYFYDSKTGDVKAMPKQTTGLGFTRPLLVQCLEKVAIECPRVTLKKGSGVSHVTTTDNGCEITLEDGSILAASHVVGADGKWSSVRESFPELSSQFTIETCPSYGVHMSISNIPKEFKTDGTYVIKPSSPESKFYIIASPRPESEEGMSISLVCYDEILIKYPWLAPPADLKTGEYRRGSWEYEYSALPASLRSEGSLVDNLKKLFEEEFPMFYRAIKHDEEVFQSARINRRVTWLKMNAEEGSYSTKDGKVTLIGDSAHSMTPSLGEGANTALESAVKLVNSIKAEMERKGEVICSIKTISDAFTQYGRSRPSETRQLQESSAARSMGSKH